MAHLHHDLVHTLRKMLAAGSRSCGPQVSRPTRGLQASRPCRSAPARPRVAVVRAAADPESLQTISYAALGLGAASFVTTFFVLPKLYTKNDSWDKDMLPVLRANGVPTASPKDAYSKASRGAVLLDVRLPEKYAELAPARSVNVPLYLPIQAWDIPSIIRRVGFAFFGVYGTELNPAFVEQARAAAGKGREVLVICETGGTIEGKKGNTGGFQSRSLKAVYYLQQAGFSKVTHVQGGLSAWIKEGLPTTDDNDDGGELVTSGGSLKLSLPFLGSR